MKNHVCKQFFNSCKDDSGSIERKELFMIMKRFQPSITEEDVAQIISTIDDDGSGKISFDGKFRIYLHQ